MNVGDLRRNSGECQGGAREHGVVGSPKFARVRQTSPKFAWRRTHASGTPWSLPQLQRTRSQNNTLSGTNFQDFLAQLEDYHGQLCVFSPPRAQKGKWSHENKKEDCKIQSLASRKRCDFENAETLRFEIVPPKQIAAVLFLKVWAPSTCRCCSTGKKHCDLEFTILKRGDLRFHSAFSFFLRYFCRNCGESCDFEYPIWKRSDRDCNSSGS